MIKKSKINDCILMNANCMDVFSNIVNENDNVIVVSDPPLILAITIISMPIL